MTPNAKAAAEMTTAAPVAAHQGNRRRSRQARSTRPASLRPRGPVADRRRAGRAPARPSEGSAEVTGGRAAAWPPATAPVGILVDEAATRSAEVAPGNVRRPVSISYNTHPNAHVRTFVTSWPTSLFGAHVGRGPKDHSGCGVQRRGDCFGVRLLNTVASRVQGRCQTKVQNLHGRMGPRCTLAGLDRDE